MRRCCSVCLAHENGDLAPRVTRPTRPPLEAIESVGRALTDDGGLSDGRKGTGDGHILTDDGGLGGGRKGR